MVSNSLKPEAFILNYILKTIISEVETKFGKRDDSFTIEIIFHESQQSHTYIDGIKINICLWDIYSEINHCRQAICELAHEAIHCLSPVPKEMVSVLEEGIATCFAHDHRLRNNLGEPIPMPLNYQNAFDLYNELIKYDENIIKKVRNIQPIISNITKADILRINNCIDDKLAEEITKKFE